MIRDEIFARAAKGDDYTCPETVCLTPDNEAVKADNPAGFTVLRRAGETMSKKVALELGLDQLFPEPAEETAAE